MSTGAPPDPRIREPAVTTRERIFTDSSGIEWEVFDEGEWNAGIALAFDLPLPSSNPGLLFVSSRDLRRLWPRPDGWRQLEDAALEQFCQRAASLVA